MGLHIAADVDCSGAVVTRELMSRSEQAAKADGREPAVSSVRQSEAPGQFFVRRRERTRTAQARAGRAKRFVPNSGHTLFAIDFSMLLIAEIALLGAIHSRLDIPTLGQVGLLCVVSVTVALALFYACGSYRLDVL